MTAPSQGISYREEDVPLENLGANAAEVVEFYGGRVLASGERMLQFQVPRKRGAGSSGSVACMLEWEAAAGNGFVTLTADREIDAARPQRLALLIAGTVGALLFTVWPFFPVMGNVAGVGLVVAVAVYLLSLRHTPHGIIASLLQQIVRAQEEQEPGGEEA